MRPKNGGDVAYVYSHKSENGVMTMNYNNIPIDVRSKIDSVVEYHFGNPLVACLEITEGDYCIAFIKRNKGTKKCVVRFEDFERRYSKLSSFCLFMTSGVLLVGAAYYLFRDE